MLKSIQKKILGETKMTPTLVSAITAYLIITPIDAILYLQWINTMNNYKWMAGGVIYPGVGLLFFLIPTLFLLNKKNTISFFESKMPKNFIFEYFINILKNMDSIKDHTLQYPNLELAGIGCMDALGGIMSGLAITNISIMLNVIISKLVLPITMISSYAVLGKRYLINHYFGVGLTIFGVLVAAIPKLVMGGGETDPVWLIVFVSSLVPAVASFIIKESYLKKYRDANVWYINSIISVFQVGIGIVSLILVKVPIKEIYVEDFGLYIKNSLACQFLGKNSMDGDDCRFSLLYLFIFQIFGTIANILMFTIIEQGSSVMFIMFNTLKTPITALMGFFLIYYNIISYTKEESFVITWLDIVSLVLVVLGSIFYAMKKEIEPDYDPVEIEDTKVTLTDPLISKILADDNNDGTF